MRDPKRIDVILQRLSNIWHKNPDLRLGQLIGNVVEGFGLYYAEDDSLIDALEKAYTAEEASINVDVRDYVFGIVEKYPSELGFVLQADTYKDYLATYTDTGFKAEDAKLSEAEFNAVKTYFKDKE